MMPGAGSFYYHTCGPLSCFILPDGGRGLPDYNQLRRAAVLPILPAALYSSSCIFIQHHNILWKPGMRTGGPIDPGPGHSGFSCRILDMGFRELLFSAAG